jgi:type II secretory pathway pseudopilin PulG
MTNFKREAAFTLVELAIVIVIIGLLVGGVLQGQELIKQAKVRTMIKSIEDYKAATYAFKAKYNDLPGDSLRHATFLPGAGIYEGNGNGVVETHLELLEYWKALGAAKLIKGTYTGHPTGVVTAAVPINDKRAPVDSASNSYMFRCMPGNAITSPYGPVFGRKGCHFYVSKIGTGLATNNLGWAIMSAEDAMAVDFKFDDGVAHSGTILGTRQSIIAGGSPAGCNTTMDPYNLASPAISDYNLDDTVGCILLFDFNP